MKAAAKVILYAHHSQGKTETQHPVAIFGDEKRARTYANVLYIAYKSGDAKSVKALDEKAPIGDDGSMPSLPKFSVISLAYDPEPFVADDGAEFASSSVAS